MHRLACLAALTIAVGVQPVLAGEAQAPLRGFTAASSRRETAWEAEFRAALDPARMRAAMARLAARPHHVGSPGGRANAEWILARFREWGLDAHIETFEVLFPTPRTRVVELVSPRRYRARLDEPAVAGDPASRPSRERLPSYNAFSADGEATAPLVYVNYGLPDDYGQLDRLGVSVKGAIVIARYGGAWRGTKPKVAAERGAVGCLIYSDPRDDGYFQGDVYPAGAWRPRQAVQRGSVMDMVLFQGDPLTPGWGATAGARRLPLSEVRVLTKIPTLPLSYADAEPLLAALGGPMAPERWRGALPIPYHVGPGPARVHLEVRSNWDLAPTYDVVATIPGGEDGDELVIRGNHHDAWVDGAEDPVSGLVALLEEARALSELRRQGWRPRRTVVYAAWDGEEAGLFGSTEWAETHAEELSRRAAVYVNSDSNGRGYLGMGGSHSLEAFVNDVARGVRDPEKGISVWKREQLHRLRDAPSDEARQELRQRADLRIGAVGAGSDYGSFLDHLGIASLDLGFSGEDGGGVYHSAYDDVTWYTRFDDPDFAYGKALAQTAGTAVLRLADAELLPFQFGDFADTMRLYVGELEKLLADTRARAAELDRELAEGVFAATSDPARPSVPPAPEPLPPALDFAPLSGAYDTLTRSAARYDSAAAAALDDGGKAPAAEVLKAVDRDLIASERTLTSPDGLPGRPWYRHLIYAPGVYTGYAVKTMAGVREAIEGGRWEEAQREIGRVAAALAAEAALLEKAARELAGEAPTEPTPGRSPEP